MNNDDFARDVRTAMNRVAYGVEVNDPLLAACARVMLQDVSLQEIGHCSNGALKFAAYVPPR